MNKEWIEVLDKCIQKWEDIRDDKLKVREIISWCAACHFTGLNCNNCLISVSGQDCGELGSIWDRASAIAREYSISKDAVLSDHPSKELLTRLVNKAIDFLKDLQEKVKEANKE